MGTREMVIEAEGTAFQRLWAGESTVCVEDLEWVSELEM